MRYASVVAAAACALARKNDKAQKQDLNTLRAPEAQRTTTVTSAPSSECATLRPPLLLSRASLVCSLVARRCSPLLLRTERAASVCRRCLVGVALLVAVVAMRIISLY